MKVTVTVPSAVAAIIEAARYGFGQPSIGEDARQLIRLDGEVSADAVAALADDLDVPDEVRANMSGSLVVSSGLLTGAMTRQRIEQMPGDDWRKAA